MPVVLRTLRAAAVNIDGVLLSDTFSPVIHRFVTGRGVAYTPQLERAVLSQPREVAARVLAEATGTAGDAGGVGETVRAYFALRERYLREHPVRVNEGALELVGRLRGLGLEVVCYGGLGRGHFERHLGAWRSRFTAPGYVCTDGFRPGIGEIVEGFGLGSAQVLFIDDAARFAEHARQARVPFIGHPSAFRHGFQRRAMRENGVRHLVDRLAGIDEALLHTVDQEAGHDSVWLPDGRPDSTSRPDAGQDGMRDRALDSVRDGVRPRGGGQDGMPDRALDSVRDGVLASDGGQDGVRPRGGGQDGMPDRALDSVRDGVLASDGGQDGVRPRGGGQDGARDRVLGGGREGVRVLDGGWSPDGGQDRVWLPDGGREGAGRPGGGRLAGAGAGAGVGCGEGSV
ncbi:hypothetical protein ACF07B_07855 [Streptomyces sp. NPDC015532]|uniref:hypothetical protein n=1 Tax=Streptomyces sp. NPDC015532 TaxID=3364960 RepID=UPI0037007BA4